MTSNISRKRSALAAVLELTPKKALGRAANSWKINFS